MCQTEIHIKFRAAGSITAWARGSIEDDEQEETAFAISLAG